MISAVNGPVVQVPEWKELSWLRHGFSTRLGGVSTVYLSDLAGEGNGDLNTGWTAADNPANVAENRRRLMASVAGSAATLVTVRQVHSAKTIVVRSNPAHFFQADGRATIEADGMMTDCPGLLLGIQTADCVPVLVADSRLRVVAAFHAGWRGTVAGIVEQGIGQLATEYSSHPEDLVAAVGPSIGRCCYSVGDEVREAFEARYDYASDLLEQHEVGSQKKIYLNLWEANRRQVVGAGVHPAKIVVMGECSGCAGLPGFRRYFSHRCEHGFTGRMMSVIGTV